MLVICIAILSVSAAVAYVKLMNRAKNINTLNQIASIISNVYAFYNGAMYKDLDNRTAVGRQLVPPEMIRSRDEIVHPFKGKVKIASVSENTGFAIMLNNLSKETCTKIASADWGSDSSGLKFFMISDIGYEMPQYFPEKLNAGEYKSEDLPLSPQRAALDCSCEKDTCGVILMFQ